MLDLTFGEQVKIILRRKGMTIKELAEKMEEHTGKKMSRQNLTQRLGRDNFQEQDMRQIAEILGCRFQLSIMEESSSADKNFKEEQPNIEIDNVNEFETEMTVGEFIDNFAAAENVAVEQVYEEEVPEEVSEEELAISVEEAYEEPMYEEPVYEEPAYEEAAYEEPVYEEPVYEEAVYEEPAYEEAVYEEPVYEEPAYEEAVYEEPVYEEPAYEEVAYEEPVQENASVEDALKELASLEQEDKAYKLEKEQKAKKKGWKDRFGFNRKKEAEQAVKTEPVKEVTPEPAYEEPVYEEVQEEAAYEEPVYEESAYDEAAYGEPVYEEPAYEAAYEEPVYEEAAYEEPVGDINPYTGREYETNSVRMHPKRIGYVQVYDRGEHKWTDMTEWAFLGYQEQKKMLLGKDYDPPIYLD